jgi:hypothetical protein
VQRLLPQLTGTAAGRSFLGKVYNIKAALEGAQGDFAAAIIPGVFRRFGEKAEAAEAGR